jgi:hypothetical protein
MEQLALEQAAELSFDNYKSPVLYKKNYTDGFEAGAEWQKEQYKRLIELIREGIPVLLTEGLDDLVDQIDTEIKLLQD